MVLAQGLQSGNKNSQKKNSKRISIQTFKVLNFWFKINFLGSALVTKLFGVATQISRVGCRNRNIEGRSKNIEGRWSIMQ